MLPRGVSHRISQWSGVRWVSLCDWQLTCVNTCVRCSHVNMPMKRNRSTKRGAIHQLCLAHWTFTLYLFLSHCGRRRATDMVHQKDGGWNGVADCNHNSVLFATGVADCRVYRVSHRVGRKVGFCPVCACHAATCDDFPFASASKRFSTTPFVAYRSDRHVQTV